MLDEKVFSNPGDKIKTIAKIIFVLGVIVSLVSAIEFGWILGGVFYYTLGSTELGFGLLEGVESNFLRFLLTLVCGGVISYVTSLLIYAFGTLVANSEPSMETETSETTSLYTSFSTTSGASANNGWRCKKCGCINQNYTGTCACGCTKEESKGQA